jgi:hypothetical protein
MRGVGIFSICRVSRGREPAETFASVFPASMGFSFPDGGAPAGNYFWMPAKRQVPFRALSRINVAETAKAPLDMTAAVVEATPHSRRRRAPAAERRAGSSNPGQ